MRLEPSGRFQDARYLPSEGAGVISARQIELPQDCNAFDFESISDVVPATQHLNPAVIDDILLICHYSAKSAK